jgi:hypothetical protein
MEAKSTQLPAEVWDAPDGIGNDQERVGIGWLSSAMVQGALPCRGDWAVVWRPHVRTS